MACAGGVSTPWNKKEEVKINVQQKNEKKGDNGSCKNKYKPLKVKANVDNVTN